MAHDPVIGPRVTVAGWALRPHWDPWAGS